MLSSIRILIWILSTVADLNVYAAMQEIPGGVVPLSFLAGKTRVYPFLVTSVMCATCVCKSCAWMESSTHTSVSGEWLVCRINGLWTASMIGYWSIRQIFNLESSPDDVADEFPQILNIKQLHEHFSSNNEHCKINKQNFHTSKILIKFIHTSLYTFVVSLFIFFVQRLIHRAGSVFRTFIPGCRRARTLLKLAKVSGGG